MSAIILNIGANRARGTDAVLFRDVGLSVVRFAEFAWSKLEPHPNEFAFDWLDRAIGTFARENFQIVLGTPTAAPPAWLAARTPIPCLWMRKDAVRISAAGAIIVPIAQVP